MSIRMIAKELYRLLQEVESLEKKIAAAPPEQREILNNELRKRRTERNRMQRVLDGSKDSLS